MERQQVVQRTSGDAAGRVKGRVKASIDMIPGRRGREEPVACRRRTTKQCGEAVQKPIVDGQQMLGIRAG